MSKTPPCAPRRTEVARLLEGLEREGEEVAGAALELPEEEGGVAEGEQARVRRRRDDARAKAEHGEEGEEEVAARGLRLQLRRLL